MLNDEPQDQLRGDEDCLFLPILILVTHDFLREQSPLELRQGIEHHNADGGLLSEGLLRVCLGQSLRQILVDLESLFLQSPLFRQLLRDPHLHLHVLQAATSAAI